MSKNDCLRTPERKLCYESIGIGYNPQAIRFLDLKDCGPEARASDGTLKQTIHRSSKHLTVVDVIADILLEQSADILNRKRHDCEGHGCLEGKSDFRPDASAIPRLLVRAEGWLLATMSTLAVQKSP
jgi:hypothetical protein